MILRLRQFHVYFKDGRKETIECHNFSIDKVTEDRYKITLYDNVGKPDGLLGFKHVAAIIPENQQEGYHGYNVKLRNDVSLVIHASHFTVDDKPGITFFYGENKIMGNIYVATSEVLSILHVLGMDYNKK
jgi:hypothetical protein